MNPKLLVVALIAALGSGCASTDKNRLAYQVVPVSAVTHGAAGAPSYYQLARYYHGQKRYDLAEAAYRKSLAIDGSQVATWNALGSLHAERGDLPGAVQQFEKALTIVPDAGYLYNNLGFAYYLQGRLDEAYDAIRKALTFDPALERGWANLERIAVAQSDPRLAAVVQARRVHALPATLLAASPADTALPSPQGISSGVAALTEPATASPQTSVTVIDAQTGETTLAKRNEAAVSVVATSDAPALPLAGAAETSADSGKFVLVSTSREVVDLAEPVRDAKLETVDVARSESIVVVTTEPVNAAKPEPVVVAQTEPVVVAQTEPVVVAQTEPVVVAKAEPVVVAKAEPVVVAKAELVVVAKAESVVVAKAESVVVPKAEPIVAANAEPRAPAAEQAAAKRETDIDLSLVKIEVTNANGISGFAKKFSALLRQDHIPVRRITNYISFLLKGTVIEYQPGYQEAARILMRRMQMDALLTPARGPRVNSDVRIVLGRDALSAEQQLLAKAP